MVVDTLQENIRAYNERDWARHKRIMAGEEAAPPCYTCKALSTKYALTPGANYSYQCDRHGNHVCWGSDCCFGRMRYVALGRDDGEE